MKQKALVLGKGKKIDWDVFEKSLHRMFGVNAVAYDKTGARKTSDDIEIAEIGSICASIRVRSRVDYRITFIDSKSGPFSSHNF